MEEGEIMGRTSRQTPTESGRVSLIERVEALSGADREIDGLIHQAVTGEAVTYSSEIHPEPCGADDCYVPPYTGSLDAAMTLARRMLPSVGLAIYTDWAIRTTEPELEGGGWRHTPNTLLGVWARTYIAPYDSPAYNAKGEARTAALAVCALVLTALLPEEAEKARKRGETAAGRTLRRLTPDSPPEHSP